MDQGAASPTISAAPPGERREAGAGFAQLLFGRVPEADLAPYPPATLAALAAAAREHLAAPRRDGRPSIRLTDLEIVQDGRPREVTVLEAINDNRPFLLDSTLGELADQGLVPALVAHPILVVGRDPEGRLARVADHPAEAGPLAEGLARESLIHVHLERVDDPAARARLVAGLERTFADVAAAVTDWGPMRAQVLAQAEAYRASPPPLAAAEVAEAVAFLEWLAADNFTFLGLRAYRFTGEETADPVEGTGLGLLRDPGVRVLRRGADLVVMTPEVRAFLGRPRALIITKASVRSRVHRRAHLDYIGVKLFAGGELAGELRLVGLFTSEAYLSPPDQVPYLRRKVAGVVEAAGFDPASYDGRALIRIMQEYPRDELFQIDPATLLEFALEILGLTERPRLRVLARADEFDRFVSVLVYIPKDRYDTGVRRRVGEFLAGLYGGRVSAVYPAYPEGPLARAHFIIGRVEGRTPRIDRATLEAGVAAIVRTWGDGLRAALAEAIGGKRARRLAARYAEAFSAAYREAFDAGQAIDDVLLLERLSDERPRAVSLYRRGGDPDTRVNLKVFSRGRAVLLSDRVPVLEDMGFRVANERTYRVVPADGTEAERVWLHDMALERAAGGPIDAARIEGPVEAALLAVSRGLAESDGFNRLVLELGLGWRDAAMLRALGRYLRQARVSFGQDYLALTLARHARVTAGIVDLFYARFDPRAEADRAARTSAPRAAIAEALKAVTSLDDDRILRRFVNLVEAATRTNFFQIEPNGLPRGTIAFKFDSPRIEGLPLPRPLFEISVYSPRVEGVHLRFGRIARGGLRWSDRPQDFRTEVLGLVKAQQVKNAVIVPVGAKGGFYPKHLPPASDRQAWMAEGTESYRIFVRTLLQLTDNIEGDRVVPPENTVRYDGDDPYLVVAADKGTATFSDTANQLSLEKGHWLGDAFASGGSHGYDHKAMGITARGAWEAVKRHFRERGTDIQREPVTVAGIGDMSGDVFGNGMLLSRALKLVAAFDHRDIFLDPDPDPERSFAERRRLFDLPRSSWASYDPALISPGGGVFPRTAKSVPLAPPVRALLGLDRDEATPGEVIRAILRAPVDLLWFGGIGTYVRASTESDDEAGDRANDAVRITGAEVRAKVIGEGANLAVTQRGRVEAARAGVRLNTDAIDNSAGVNTSDVEVNIKIALSTPERDGRLTFESRNRLLAEMTDDVAALVLRNNYLQTLALSLAERRAAADLGFHRRLMQALEAAGRLDRAVEFLPDDAALGARARAGEGLTRPELAVLLAYAKLALHDELLASPVPDDPYLARELARYFPKAIRDRFPDAVAGHRLRREIIATQLANAIVNRGGPAVITRLRDETGADAPRIAAAYAATRDAFGLSELNASLDALDGAVPGALQLQLYAEVQDLTLNRIVWFLRQVDLAPGTLEATVALYRDGIGALERNLDRVLTAPEAEALAARAAALSAQGVPEPVAHRIAALRDLVAGPDIVLVASRSGRPAIEVAATYFAVETLFRLGALAGSAREIAVTDYYDRLALDRAVDALATAHRRITAEIIAGGEAGAAAVEAWTAGRGADVARIQEAVGTIAASGLTLSKLNVAAGLLGDLAR